MIANTEYSPYGVNLGLRLSPFGFAGEWTDPDTNHSYLWARWLDTTTGTFLSRDPLIQTTGDAYGYAAGNPLSLVDPLGLDALAFMDESWFLDFNDFVGAMADEVTMGGTAAYRKLLDIDNVKTCSVAYKWGHAAGVGASFITPGGVAKQGIKAGANAGKSIAANAAKTAVKPKTLEERIFAGEFLDASKEGITYYRTDKNGVVAPYVGQAFSKSRYAARQREHGDDYPLSDFDFLIIANGDPDEPRPGTGRALSRREEFMIRSLGGIIKEGGKLSNKRHQMVEEKYKRAGGDLV